MAGTLLKPEQALDVGMIDAVEKDADSTVAAAVNWCEQHLALPGVAMSGNRRLMRQSLCDLFDDLGKRDIEMFVNVWFGEETQQTLHALVASLKSK